MNQGRPRMAGSTPRGAPGLSTSPPALLQGRSSPPLPAALQHASRRPGATPPTGSPGGPDYNPHNAPQARAAGLAELAAAANRTGSCWLVPHPSPGQRGARREPQPGVRPVALEPGRAAARPLSSCHGEHRELRGPQGVLRDGRGGAGPGAAGHPDSRVPRSEYSGGQKSSGAEEDFLKRYKQEQARVQDELFQVVTREREAATKHRSASLQRGEGSVDQEKRKSAQLARELESREAELNRRDTFYKEQLGRLEKKNAEMYKLSSQQFHEAASKMEGTIKPRRIEPVCSGLQAQILHCYRDHLQEVLLCSDLVKAYQHCVSAAHKDKMETTTQYLCPSSWITKAETKIQTCPSP
uniref:Plexin A1 n=2 Tax=Canis lupus familiaris TaxID=9615 RepID=A0A8P0NVI1_CANLF